MSDARSQTLISTAELAACASLILLDVRDEKAMAPAERKFIAGAQETFLDTDFSGAPSKLGGKRPLPEIAALQANARRWGINPDSLVVVYDDASGAQAARAWWTLRWAGFGNVRLLDGGLAVWMAEARAVTQAAASSPGAGSIVLSAGHMPTLDADQAALLARTGLLFDARGKAGYLGAPAEAGKPPTGHIPGAISASSTESIGADARFKSGDDLRARFAALGADSKKQVGVYCGSGNAAAHLIAGLAAIGVEAPLYVGSWSAWSADPARPVAIGAQAG